MRLFGLFLLSTAIAGCGGSDGGTTPTATPASITVAPANPGSVASIGATVPLTAVVRDASSNVIANASVSWTSSNTSVASVAPATGLATTVTSVGNGSSTITAHTGAGGAITATSTINVQQALSTVTLAAPATTLVLGGSPSTVQLTVTPKDASGTAITGLPAATFSATNSNVTVSSGGVVTAQALGTSDVTATVDGVVSNKVTITVSNQSSGGGVHHTVTASGTTFTPSTITIARNDIIDFTFSPSHTVTWDSALVPAGGNIGTLANPISSGTVSRTFTVAGTYEYHCEIHGSPGAGMHGTITVTP